MARILNTFCFYVGRRCCVFLWHQTGPQTSGAPRSRRGERKTSRGEHDRSQQTLLASVYVLVGIGVLPISFPQLKVLTGSQIQTYLQTRAVAASYGTSLKWKWRENIWESEIQSELLIAQSHVKEAGTGQHVQFCKWLRFNPFRCFF